MNSILKQNTIPLSFLALVGLMLATRIHHFGSAFSLPDASLAIFFLAGLYFKPFKLFVFLLLEAAAVDYMAIHQFNVSDWCVSPAYIGLIPTYAAMWLAGRYAAELNQNTNKELVFQFGLLALAASSAFLISNGSFYLFSGRYAEMAISLYSERVAQYYLPYLTATLIYTVVIVAGVKAVQVVIQQQAAARDTVH